MMDSALTAKQQRFVEEYLVDLNATQAAIRAGYSEKTAQAIGSENLTKPLIAEAIAEARALKSEELSIAAKDVLKGLLLEARREGDGATHSARVTAWTRIGEHLGLFKQVHEHSGLNGAPLQTQQVAPDYAGILDQVEKEAG